MALRLPGAHGWGLQQWPRAVDERVEAIPRDPVPRGHGTVIVDLGDHDAGVLERVGKVIDADAQAAAALAVGRRDLHERDVAREGVRGEQAGKRREVAWHHAQAGDPPEPAKRPVGEDLEGARSAVGDSISPREPDERPHASDRLGLREQRVDQHRRLGARLAEDDAVAGHDPAREVELVLPQLDRTAHPGNRFRIVPVPSPPPQHIVTSPSSVSDRSSSCRIVVTSRAPVDPTG